MLVRQIRPSADTTTTIQTVTADSLAGAIKDRSLFAAACAPQEQGDPNSNCKPLFKVNGIIYDGGGVDPNPASTGTGGFAISLINRLLNQQNFCFESWKYKTPPTDDCRVFSENDGFLYMDVSVAYTDTNFANTFEHLNVVNYETDKVGYIGSGSARFKTQQKTSKDMKINDYRWDIIATKGQAAGDIQLLLTGNLSNESELHYFGNTWWNITSGHWVTSIEGQVDLKFTANWDWQYSEGGSLIDDVVIDKLEFCSKGCQIKVTDDIQFEGSIKKSALSGSVKYAFKRTEFNTGTGFGDAKTGKVYWNTDKQTKMNEDRSITLNLSDPSAKGDNYIYVEKYHSDSLNQPFKTASHNNYDRQRRQRYSFQGLTPTPTTNTKTVDGKFDYDYTNNNGAVAITGGGSLTVGDETTSLASDGENKIDEAMTSGAPQKYRDLVSNLQNQVMYDRNTDPKVMASPAVKVMPKHIVAILYSNKDDVADRQRPLLQSLVASAKQLGIDATYYEVTTKEDFLSILKDPNKFPDSSWLVIGGHGAALGPWADGTTININTIRKALDDRHISLLVAGSCNSARWSSIADETLGSVGFGNTSLKESQLGAIAGLGGNPFSFSSGDLSAYLSNILNQGTCKSAEGSGSVLGSSPITPLPGTTPSSKPSPSAASTTIKSPATAPIKTTAAPIKPVKPVGAQIISNIKNAFTNLTKSLTKKSTPAATTVK